MTHWCIYDMTHSYLWFDTWICMQWLTSKEPFKRDPTWFFWNYNTQPVENSLGVVYICIYIMTHWCICDMTHSYLWFDACICMLWLTSKEPFKRNPNWFFWNWNTQPVEKVMGIEEFLEYQQSISIGCPDWDYRAKIWFVAWLSCICDMTRLSVWCDSFMCMTWLVCVCGMTHCCVWHDLICMCVWPDLMCVCVWRDCLFMCVWHDLLIWYVHGCMSEWYESWCMTHGTWLTDTWLVNPWLIDTWLIDPWLIDPWLIDTWLIDTWLIEPFKRGLETSTETCKHQKSHIIMIYPL